MSRFYITQIAASGPNVEFSAIPLKDGVNFIVGPSNTGKSYVINCIDFMLGGKEPPFSKEDTGYDKIHLTLESDDGYWLSATRMIEDGKNGDRGSNIVTVETTIPGVENTDYKISSKEYSDLLLRLMGIEERPSIIATQAAKSEDLTFRTMVHFFFISEDNIFEKATAFDIPKHSKITASLTSLIYLLSGDDLKRYIPEVSAEELERLATQKTGVINYLNSKISALTEQKVKLEEALAADTDIDIDGKINDIVTQIEIVEKEIVDATEESRRLLEQIFTINARLQEARYLRDRYKALRTQYVSDIKRLAFIADGNKKSSGIAHKVNCPFCGHDMEEAQSREPYVESAKAELTRIRLQLEDLQVAETDANNEIIMLENQLKELNVRNNSITQLINQRLRPKAQELRAMVAEYKRILQLRQELAAISYMSTTLSIDVFEKQNEEDETASTFNAKEVFDRDIWRALSDDFNAMVKACAYPGSPDSYLSIDTADAVVGGRHKKNQGKGYRAFLNTIMLFNLMKHLEEHGSYALHLLVLDSPILSLKEKKYGIAENEVATFGMKESLIRYIIENCGKNQVIIAENELPEAVDYTKATVITFTQTEAEGARYGFFKTKL